MKKLFSIILSIAITASLAAGLAGCKKEEKEKYTPTVFTITVSENVASEPLVVMDDFDNLYTTVLKTTDYSELVLYYEKFFSGSFSEKFFFVRALPCYTSTHNDTELLILPEADCSVYRVPVKRDESLKWMVVIEKYSVETANGKNIDFCIIHYPLNNYTYTPQVMLEFGEEAFESGLYSNYVNLYFDGVCTSTCYYKTELQISKSWMEDFLSSFLEDELNQLVYA